MRTARISITAQVQLRELLAQGAKYYEPIFLETKRLLFYAAVRSLLDFPARRATNRGLGLRLYRVQSTPFLIAYDFDEVELRIHTVFHHHADRHLENLRAIEW